MCPSTDKESINFLLAQVCKLHHARAHALLEELGLYRGQPPVLHALWDQEGLTHGELAERLHVQPATITKMIQRMEKAGFVQRRSDLKDERISRVYLTDAGHSIQNRVRRVWAVMEAETFAGLDTEERDVLYGLFLRIRENLIRTSQDIPCAPLVWEKESNCRWNHRSD